MSEVRVNNIVDYGGKGAPTFDNGAVISGVSSLGNQAKIGSNVTITSGGINVSGVTTAATLSGNLTGDVNTGFVTATSTVIGSGVTINAGGLNITGVVTATTFEGSGASLTGVAMTITPLAYNPDVSDSVVPKASGIGITFDHRILAGSGNVTLSIANAGVAGTVVENFGVGSSVTIQGRKAIIDPTSDLTAGETYHINYPSGSFTNTSGDVSYVGTAYTFGVKPEFFQLWTWGNNETYGQLGQNQAEAQLNDISSPVQIPGFWTAGSHDGTSVSGIKNDGTLMSWGSNVYGQLGVNSRESYSSPVQVPGTGWSKISRSMDSQITTKTDGTLWVMGQNDRGQLGQNNLTRYSSPTQIPGTTWSEPSSLTWYGNSCVKTDGTLWVWGSNTEGALGQNNKTQYSSPTQIPGTTWSIAIGIGGFSAMGLKTDGTLWGWGDNQAKGQLGQSGKTEYSSPIQIPGTTWKSISSGAYNAYATKTDGTLWSWGYNNHGQLGQNSRTDYSSPKQIPGTTWDLVRGTGYYNVFATKTDGTLWTWGRNTGGALGQNQPVSSARSSPVQVPGATWSLNNMQSAERLQNGNGFAFRQLV